MLINNISMHNSPYYPPIYFLVLLPSPVHERCWKRWGISGLQQAEWIHEHKIWDLHYADDTILQSHCARGLSYLDKQNGEKMPEFKSKKDQAYEDWQTKGRCKIEIKVNGEILEWFSRDLQLTFGDGDGLEKIRRSRLAMAINELLKL